MMREALTHMEWVRALLVAVFYAIASGSEELDARGMAFGRLLHLLPPTSWQTLKLRFPNLSSGSSSLGAEKPSTTWLGKARQGRSRAGRGQDPVLPARQCPADETDLRTIWGVSPLVQDP